MGRPGDWREVSRNKATTVPNGTGANSLCPFQDSRSFRGIVGMKDRVFQYGDQGLIPKKAALLGEFLSHR